MKETNRKEFNDFCDKNNIANLTAGQQLLESCYDKLKVSFVKDTESFPSNGVVETINENDLYTTDLKKCREIAETVLWRKFLEGVKWETFNHEELKKVFDVVGGIIVAKEKI